MPDDPLGDEVRADDLQILVGDDERNVVVARNEVVDQRVLRLDRAAQHVAVQLLHGVGPEGHIVLLLLLEAESQLIGIEERERPEQGARHDHRHAVAEGEDFTEFHRSVISARYPARRGSGGIRSCRAAVRRPAAPRGPTEAHCAGRPPYRRGAGRCRR